MEASTIVIFLLGVELTLTDKPRANLTQKMVEKKNHNVGSMNWFPNFTALTQRTTFVDKTLMAATFLNVSDFPEFALMTCPRKFGKSTNLDMMKIFAEAPICNSSTTNKICKCTNVAHSQILKKCDVSMKITPWLRGDVELYNERCENFATHEVSFKFHDTNTMEKILDGFRNCLKSCYEKYRWVLNIIFNNHGSGQLSKDVREDDTYSVVRLKRAWNVLNGKRKLNEEDIVIGFRDLSDILIEKYPAPDIFWLIDDYDEPILKAIEFNLDVVRVSELVQRIFSSLFRSPDKYMRYALITGTLNVLDKYEFNYIRRWNFLDDHLFAEYFGFTDDEVDRLFSKHNIGRNKGNAAKQYYGSYNIAGTQTRIYNPYSITRYASSRERNTPDNVSNTFENYWTGMKEIANFLRCFKNNCKYRKVIVKLLELKQVKFELKKYWNVGNLSKLKDIAHNSTCDLTAGRVDLVLSYLFYNGYLSHGDKPGTYRVPGEEVGNFLSQLLKNEDKSVAIEDAELHAKLSPNL